MFKNTDFSSFHHSLYFRCKPSYQVTFIRKDGERITASGKEGDSLLDVVVNNNLDFDGYGKY